MKICVITRFCYKEIVEPWRLQLFQDNFINSLKLQSDNQFDIFIRHERFSDFEGHPTNLEKVKSLDWGNLNVHLESEPKFQYDVEIRLDSDDFFSSEFIAFIRKTATTATTDLLINFKPIKFHHGRYYRHERDYSDNCGSMFLALVQKGEKTKGVNDRPHCSMAKHIGNVLTVSEGYCFLNIHENNMTSKMLGKEVEMDYFNSSVYWLNRYRNGGNSGMGSYGKLAEYKAQFVNNLIAELGMEKVIELGCGDGNQMSLFKAPKYIGYDISHECLEKCMQKRKDYEFRHISEYVDEPCDLKLSLDVIYHLNEDSVFDTYMRRLFSNSQYVLVYSSNTNVQIKGQAKHLRQRQFSDWVSKNTNYKMIKHTVNPYRYDGTQNTSIADFYLYESNS